MRSAFVGVAMAFGLGCGLVRAEISTEPLWDTRLSFLESGPDVSIGRTSSGVGISVTFQGALETAPDPGGPWVPIPGAASPFAPETLAARQFFRVADGGVFSSGTVVSWEVSGPLQHHFDLAFAGSPDGIFPPRRVKPYFDGVVTLAGVSVPVSLRVRGNSSLQECPFPKLKVKVSRADREGTPFQDAREIKIGTHCADGGHGGIGRLRDERATYREALAYEAMNVLGFLTPRVRRARIEFHDTGSPDAPNPGGWTMVRNALLLEDPEVVADRLGGEALNDEEIAALTDARFGVQLITDLRFLHALLGNWDFRLSEDGRGLWNTDVIRKADGQQLPLAGDFDLSSWVTETVRLTPPPDYRPELPHRDRQVRYDLEEIQSAVAPDVFESARARFTAHRAGLESLVAGAIVDDAGRTNAAAHVVTFFDGLAATGR